MSIMLTLAAVLPPKLLLDSDEGHTYLLTSEERANVAVETGTGTFSKTRESRHETRHNYETLLHVRDWDIAKT